AGPGVRTGMVGPAVLAWGVLPLAFGVHRPLLLIVPMVVGLIVLTLVAVRPSLVLLIPLALAADLSVNGLALKALPCCDERRQPALASEIEPIQPGDRPRVAASAYTRPGAIVRALRRGPPGRYVSIGGRLWDSGFRRAPANWAFMGTQRSMLFGLEEAQGYNPAQLDRYWRFVRAVQREPIVYNR